MKAPNIQAPSSKEAPMAKLQAPRRLFESAPWSLEPGISLELGIWDLETTRRM